MPVSYAMTMAVAIHFLFAVRARVVLKGGSNDHGGGNPLFLLFMLVPLSYAMTMAVADRDRVICNVSFSVAHCQFLPMFRMSVPCAHAHFLFHLKLFRCQFLFIYSKAM